MTGAAVAQAPEATDAGGSSSAKRKRRELLNSARMGVREAQYELGLLHASGNGVKQDFKEAVSWIRKAAEKGLAAAQYVLATQYAAGLTGSRDDATAYAWFQRAADQGHPRAMFRLAKMQEVGQPELAFAQQMRAAELGLPEAQFAVGKAYAAGCGVAEDAAASLSWVRKAADQGLAAAQHELAERHAEGRGGAPADAAAALAWYRKAAAQDHPPAVFALGCLDANGVGRMSGAASSTSHDGRRDRRRWLGAADPIDADGRYHLGLLFELGIDAPLHPDKARHWYGLAARQGDSRAQTALARLLEANDPEAALGLYAQAAALGEASAQLALGRIHSSLAGDPHEAFKGALWYGRAAEAGQPLALLTLGHLFLRAQEQIAHHCFQGAAELGVAQAQFALAQLYRDGIGVELNLALAADWFRRAAEQGHAPAQCALGLCHLYGHGVLQSAEQARHWLQQAADQGEALAQWNLSALHASGAPGIAQDLAQAFVWCEKAAAQGLVAAQATLGLLHAQIDRPDKAVALWTEAAAAGDAESQYNLGLLLAKGQGCRKDARAAFGCFVQAAEHGLRQAQSRLGLLYATGDGVARDAIEAHKWFVIAGRGGDAAARANRKHSESQLDEAQIDEAVRRADAWSSARRAAAVQLPQPTGTAPDVSDLPRVD